MGLVWVFSRPCRTAAPRTLIGNRPVWSGHPVICLLTHGKRSSSFLRALAQMRRLPDGRLDHGSWSPPSRGGWDSQNYVTMALTTRITSHQRQYDCESFDLFRSKKPSTSPVLSRLQHGRRNESDALSAFPARHKRGLLFTLPYGSCATANDLMSTIWPRRLRRLAGQPLSRPTGR